MAERKTTHVVMLGNSRGARAGDVVAVSPDQAAALVRDGLARTPIKGEVKEAKGE